MDYVDIDAYNSGVVEIHDHKHSINNVHDSVCDSETEYAMIVDANRDDAKREFERKERDMLAKLQGFNSRIESIHHNIGAMA